MAIDNVKVGLDKVAAKINAVRTRTIGAVGTIVAGQTVLANMATSEAVLITEIGTYPGTAPDYVGSSQAEAVAKDELAKLIIAYQDLKVVIDTAVTAVESLDFGTPS